MDEEGLRECEFCCQLLGHSAYYRHLHDENGMVCQGRMQHNNSDHSDTSSNFDFDASFEHDSVSSFDFGSEPGNSLTAIGHCEVDSELGMMTDSSESDDSLMSFTSESDGEEIWDLESSADELANTKEQETTDVVRSVLYGSFLFLNIFQLFYRVSERAMTSLLAFIQLLFTYLAHITKHVVLIDLANKFPRSLYSIRKYFQFSTEDITEYVVCPRCSALYEFDDCLLNSSGRSESNVCSYVEFPNHPHISRRKKCGTVLLKQIKVGRKSKLVPRKSFMYHHLINALEKLVKKPNFLCMCEHWRTRHSKFPPNFLGDIYEGRVWKSLNVIDGRPYLALPNNLCLCLNIDWFNPYDETPYSAGAMYLTVLNLPRTERYKLENFILVGIMPGPHEPKNCNGFLKPMVNDLETLFQGVNMKSASTSHLVRAMLMCISCDLPATRKVCGFQNFNAKLGCSKCLKEFITASFGEKPNYGGYMCEDWSPRDKDIQKRKSLECKNANSAALRTKLEQSYGAKYSELVNLPSFDIVRYHVIDPMHNIFLGLAKHTIKVWKDLDILSTSVYSVLQDKVDSVTPPSKIGRIPRKIQAGFSSFTADEWKNWIIFYSVFALHDVIPTDDFRCWCLLVDSCRLLCQPVLTTGQVDEAHDLLVSVLKTYMGQLTAHLTCTCRATCKIVS